jgi:accessory gene regulator protein AgrB
MKTATRLRHIDRGSQIVIVVTFVLFALSLVVKGFSHDLLLEAGVFLVSVKLILITYKNGKYAESVVEKLERIETSLERLEHQQQNGIKMRQ